jgi:hypothetical protein
VDDDPQAPGNWLVWIAVDVVYVPLLAYKGLYAFAVLYAVFLGLAVKGTWSAARPARARGGAAGRAAPRRGRLRPREQPLDAQVAVARVVAEGEHAAPGGSSGSFWATAASDAPLDGPTKIPSSRAQRRAISNAASSSTWITPSSTSRCRLPG